MSARLDAALLGAYVDGELPPQEVERVERHLATSPEDRRTVETLREMNVQLTSAFGAPLREPLPPRLGSRLARAAARSSRRAGQVWPFAAGAALAASVAVTAVLVGGYLGDAAEPPLAVGGTAPSSPLHALLESAPDGGRATVGDGTATLTTTFIDDRSDPCRELEWSTGASFTWAIACRRGDEWRVEVAVARPATAGAGPDAYVPASGANEEVMDAALEALGAGPVLGPDAVESLIDTHWEPL